MLSPVQRCAVDHTDTLRNGSATRNAARLIPALSRETRPKNRSRPEAVSRLAFVLLATGCSSFWGRRPLDQPTRVKPDQPVWIWSERGVEKWHGVVITQDSVMGYQYGMPLMCGGCRRSHLRTQVDSMKLGYHTAVENVTKGAGHVLGSVTMALVGVYAMCTLFRIWSPKCLD